MVLVDYLLSRQILNSRGEPTIEVSITLTDGKKVTASAPSGKSTSPHEAVEQVDKDYSHYFGKSVEQAVEMINTTVAPRLKKLSPTEQLKADQILLELDGTPNLAHLGTNSTTAISMAFMKAGAVSNDMPLYQYINDFFRKIEAKDRYGEYVNVTESLLKPGLPIPAFNLINGGEHGDTSIPIQEYLVLPVGIAKTSDRIRAASEIFYELKQLLIKAGKSTNVGDEGGFSPQYDNALDPFLILVEAVKRTNYNMKNAVLYGFDVAGAKLPDNFYPEVLGKYPVISVEDPYEADDWEHFALINHDYPDIFTVGDDLIATNISRLYQAQENNAVGCVIVKPNQVGTITETIRFAKVAKHAGMALFVAHRSGETNDTFIVDLAVGLGAKFLKAGAPNRGERVAKYNHLLDVALSFEESE